jgi:hypothetical protein
MPLVSTPRQRYVQRRLGPVPWYHDGCHGLAVQAGENVPSFDDQMIRGALARGALSCKRIEGLPAPSTANSGPSATLRGWRQISPIA